MCRKGPEEAGLTATGADVTHDSHTTSEPFPWDLPVLDAHCHPTDTMSSIPSISDMRARALTIMATRSQDQDLVAALGASHGIASRKALASPAGSSTDDRPQRVVPSFGWHPWFSYQLYDDVSDGTEPTYSPSAADLAAEKARHFAAVLHPPPDSDFVAALPEPTALSAFLVATRERLRAHPAALVGEVGIDKAFRLPRSWAQSGPEAHEDGLTPGGREGRLLSPYRVGMAHQVVVLQAQLRLAASEGRGVSVHGVQAHGVLFDALKGLWRGHEREVVSRRKRKMVAPGAEDFSSSDEDDEEEEEAYDADGAYHDDPPEAKNAAADDAPVPWTKPFPPRICLHSFSASPEVAKQYVHPAVPARIFFSFSACINLAGPAVTTKTEEVLRVLPEGAILVESDLHVAGAEMDDALEAMYRWVCDVKGWTLREGVTKVARNYEAFVFG